MAPDRAVTVEVAAIGGTGNERGVLDIERALEANASLAVLATLALGRLVHRRFYALTGIVAGFFLNHAVRGWCPPLPALRRMGFRTPREIEDERRLLENALRVRQGDATAPREDRSERAYIPYTD